MCGARKSSSYHRRSQIIAGVAGVEEWLIIVGVGEDYRWPLVCRRKMPDDQEQERAETRDMDMDGISQTSGLTAAVEWMFGIRQNTSQDAAN